MSTEPIDYKARIKAKGADGTGITREHAKRMANTQGQHTMLIVDVEHARLIIEEDGSQQIMLTITSAEPVPAELEDPVRRFQRALYLSRPDVAGQAILSGTADGETPAEAVAGMTASVTTDEDGEVAAWDGDPDAPLTGAATLASVPDPVDDLPVDGESCGFPGCFLPEGHEGDHEDSAEG